MLGLKTWVQQILQGQRRSVQVCCCFQRSKKKRNLISNLCLLCSWSLPGHKLDIHTPTHTHTHTHTHAHTHTHTYACTHPFPLPHSSPSLSLLYCNTLISSCAPQMRFLKYGVNVMLYKWTLPEGFDLLIFQVWNLFFCCLGWTFLVTTSR